MSNGYRPQTKLERRAYSVASRAHNGQMRKAADSTPYIVHPLNVALLLQQSGESSRTIATGLLHDVLEKSLRKYSRQQMRNDFGYDITNSVVTLTKNPSIDDWYERNELYLATMFTTQNLGALSVCAADKSSNLADTLHDYPLMGEEYWSRFKSDKDDQLWWFSSVHEVLHERIPQHPLVQRLGKQVIDLKDIAS